MTGLRDTTGHIRHNGCRTTTGSMSTKRKKSINEGLDYIVGGIGIFMLPMDMYMV